MSRDAAVLDWLVRRSCRSGSGQSRRPRAARILAARSGGDLPPPRQARALRRDPPQPRARWPCGVEMLDRLFAALGLVTGAAWAGARWNLLDHRLARGTLLADGAGARRSCWSSSASGLPGRGPGCSPTGSSTTPGRCGGAGGRSRCRCRWAPACSTPCCTASPAASHDEIDEESFEEEIRTIVTEGHREGLLEEDAREMIEGVIDLGDADVSQIMTPRTDMHMIHVDVPWDEVLSRRHRVGPHAHSRVRQEPRRHRRHSLQQGPAARVGHGRSRARAPRSANCSASPLRARDQAGRRPAADVPADCARTWPSCSTSTAASRAW